MVTMTCENRCPFCGEINPEDAIFCGGCGKNLGWLCGSSRLEVVVDDDVPAAPVTPAAPVEKICKTCGESNPDDAVFCGVCGSRLTGTSDVTSSHGGVAREKPKVLITKKPATGSDTSKKIDNPYMRMPGKL